MQGGEEMANGLSPDPPREAGAGTPARVCADAAGGRWEMQAR